jgi:hypothetical protein
MSRVRDTVNAGLRRVTGYQLQKAGSPAPAASARRPPRAAPAPKKAAPKKAAPKKAAPKKAAPKKAAPKKAAKKGAAKQAATGGPRRPKLALEVRQGWDDRAVATVQRVAERTMTSPEKIYGLVQAVRYVVRHDVPGEIVECGVWRGGSMQAAALTLIEQGDTGRELHLFDTFEGMPPPTDKDVRPDGASAADLLDSHGRDHRVWAVAGLDDVTDGMDETGYPPERIHYHQGLVQDTIPGRAPEQIAVLRLDTDWYESTRHELAHLYERLSPGGVLIIDDYGDWQGARLATEEFLDGTAEPILLVPLGSGRIAVKPR